MDLRMDVWADEQRFSKEITPFNIPMSRKSICLEIFLVQEVSRNEIGKKNIHTKGIRVYFYILFMSNCQKKNLFYKTKENLEAKTDKLGNKYTLLS